MNAIGAARTLRAVFLTVAALVLINAAWRSFENYPLIQGRRAHRWLVDLAAEDITIRQRAADVLRREPALAVPVLTQALLNREQPFGHWLACQANRIAPQFFELRDHTAVRSAAARLLGSLGSSAAPAVPALIVGATAPEWRLREDAAVALMELGPLAAPTLATTLDSETDNTTALRCAEILRRMGPAAAVAIDQILSGFNDGRPAIRVALAPVLAQEWANTEKVITALTAATKSVHEGLQVAALRALGQHRGLPETARLALERQLINETFAIRFAAAAAWVDSGADPSRVLPHLRHGLHVELSRAEAVALIGRLGPVAEPAIPELLGVLVDERSPRPLRMPPSAGLALRQIGGPALDGVIKLLGHSNEVTRVNAVVTVGLFGERAQARGAALVTMLADPQVDVRHAAALCLSSIGWHVRDAVPVLQSLLREDDPFLVTWAGDALEKIDPKLMPERSAR